VELKIPDTKAVLVLPYMILVLFLIFPPFSLSSISSPPPSSVLSFSLPHISNPLAMVSFHSTLKQTNQTKEL
jgi:hypothetical protein